MHGFLFYFIWYRSGRTINSSANVFVFGDFNIHQKYRLTYSGRTDIPGELSYIFSISVHLTQMVNFPNLILDCDSLSPALLDSFLFLALVLAVQCLSLH